MRRLAFVILYVVIHSSKLSFTNWLRLATVIAPTTAGVVLSIGSVKQRGFGLSEAFKLGLGAVNVHTIITDWKIPSSGRRAMWSTAILANMGQPLLSLVHYAYNSLFTAIYLSIECDSYGRRNDKCTRLKGLRVSEVPRGSQRTAHFLQLPFRYGIPLSLASGLLHWLASQSFFAVSLVRASDIIDVDTHINYHHEGFLSCGFSSLAMLMLLAGLLLLLLVSLVTALLRFGNGMPVVGACSAAIAAACHSVSESPNDIHTLPLCWGVISTSADGEVSCAFSAEDVPFPRQSMPFSLWQEKTASALNEEGLARFHPSGTGNTAHAGSALLKVQHGS